MDLDNVPSVRFLPTNTVKKPLKFKYFFLFPCLCCVITSVHFPELEHCKRETLPPHPQLLNYSVYSQFASLDLMF